MSSGVYKVGIVGCGRIASLFEDDPLTSKPCTHAGSYNSLENVRLIAACDIRQDRLDKFYNKWGVNSLYLDYRDMLRKEDLDIVSICTHSPEHKEICVEAVKSGVKAIFCEKPMATSLREAEEMISVCKKNDVVLAVDHTRRWDVYFQKVKSLIDDNKIGKLHSFDSYATVGLMNGGVHLFDLLRYYCGDAESVIGYLRPDGTTDPGGVGLIKFKNNIFGSIDSTWRDYVLFGVTLAGVKGTIRAGGMIRSDRDFELFLAQKSKNESGIKELMPEKIEFGEWRPPLVNAIENIISHLENNSPLLSTGEDGYAALEIALAFHESSNNGSIPIKLPLRNKDLRIVPRETSFTLDGKLRN